MPSVRKPGQKEEILMNNLKMLGLAAVAAMALMAVTAGSASATTLEIGGVAQNKQLTIAGSASSAVVLSDTEGFAAHSCSVSSFHGLTSLSSGTKVTAGLSVGLSFGTCVVSPVTVETKGSLYIENEGSTKGNVFSEGTAVTWNTSFGFHITCTTLASGTKIGTLDPAPSASGHATMTIAAVLSCGFLMPSASWKGSYKVSTPTGLGVVA
jgi:hypothetical protein